ncbi:hypothetical protein XELAEV_18041657mg [Xenopus laevis]|uniref:Uncharacterized protein n=1 Tax=Xenopus laevis TaxID=8355 RepID=A0A974H5B8_XENLA|nr:hypothetical protein XELAEV_18041657mg [Xenopus laevis]
MGMALKLSHSCTPSSPHTAPRISPVQPLRELETDIVLKITGSYKGINVIYSGVKPMDCLIKLQQINLAPGNFSFSPSHLILTTSRLLKTCPSKVPLCCS